MKYHITTFGCQMNRSDSERIASVLESMGYEETIDLKGADLAVINMCSVRQSAVDRVYGLSPLFMALKTKNKAFRAVLTGCILKPERAKLASVFDFILDKEDMANWPLILKGKNPKKKSDYLKITPKYGNGIQAFVPISNGCDNFCTYCAVPYTRGRLVSRSYKDIVSEVKNLVKKGYKEVWLLGENVNSYRSGKFNFSKLIKEMNEIEEKFWLRFTSPHPKDFSDELIKTLSQSSHFAPYINLPAQAGDDFVLRKMNRPYTREKYLSLIGKIRKAFKDDIAISTDIIVGFPGEIKERFKNTEKLMKEVGFDMAYIAEYSPRPQSFACEKMEDDISLKEKKRRSRVLTQILKKAALKNNKKMFNKETEVLVLSKEGKYYDGRTFNNKPVRFESEKDLLGKFVRLRITKASPWNLEGDLVKPKLLVILGPTASGKTDLALFLAKEFNGELVSADSRMIYKGMDIGTNKPKEFHHMIDIVSPDQEFSVALYKKMALEKMEQIIEKGKLPILVGGTGLYIRSIVENLDFPSIKADKKLRKELEKKTVEELFKMYKKLDKKGAQIIDKNNKRRMVRAIEVCLLTNEPFFKERKGEPLFDVLEIGIKVNKNELKERIDKRVDLMFKQGLEKEAKKLFKKYGFKIPPMQTIGYQEWQDYFKGIVSKEEVKEKIKANTFKFAKRQMTWFKKDKNIRWI
ncbi:MAG: tRNA (N6-isopentenyl adenosine(37)-C2)-methylthiotransferase MiaB [Candidatus Pacebacteria bacterium]|nr:tRNA (N6-isopentenyl adenosine(37)-C2)-methylthiotransferase MiaB [Candidatus Paceibacterota bacterium]